MKKLILILALSISFFGNDLQDAGFAYDMGDYSKAAKLYTKACDGGNAWGCGTLGILYNEGKGVKQDYSKAAKLYTKACDGGNAWICVNLGYMYLSGKGVKQDNFKASRTLYKSL